MGRGSLGGCGSYGRKWTRGNFRGGYQTYRESCGPLIGDYTLGDRASVCNIPQNHRNLNQ